MKINKEELKKNIQFELSKPQSNPFLNLDHDKSDLVNSPPPPWVGSGAFWPYSGRGRYFFGGGLQPCSPLFIMLCTLNT